MLADSVQTVDDILEIADRLSKKYGDWDHGNPKDPLLDLLYILCSVRANGDKFAQSYRSLIDRFPDLGALATAPVEEIAPAIVTAGLQNQKAATIQKVMNGIVAHFGEPTLSSLAEKSDQECERFLTSLPGVGIKVARCVMLCGLGRLVFPVDTHCWRICCRLGWISPDRVGSRCTRKDMDFLQNRIPAELRFSLHVNMISLGREVCTARTPRCNECLIREYCHHARQIFVSGASLSQ